VVARRKKTLPAAVVRDRDDRRGTADSIAWYAFLALVALTPVVLGVPPLGLGPISSVRMLDTVQLPKLVVLAVLSGVSLIALGVSVLRGESKLRWHPALWPLLAFIVWAGVSTVFSASPGGALLGGYNSDEGLFALVTYAVVAFVAVQEVRSVRALRSVAVVAVASGLIVSAYAALQSFGIDPLVYTGEVDRVFATLGNADMLGNYLLFPLTLAVGLALSTRNARAKYGWSAAALFVGWALLLSGTRGAWVGAAVIAFGVAILSWNRMRALSTSQRWMLAGGVVAAVVAILAVLVYANPLSGRGVSLSSGLTTLSNGRTVIWLTGLRGWLVHPVVGWGPDNFGHAFQRAVGADWYAIVAGLQTAGNAHNLYVQTLVTLGLPGLALAVWALVQTAAQTFSHARSAEGPNRGLTVAVWSLLIGLMVALAFGVTDPGVTVWLWLTAGLLLASVAKPLENALRPLPIVGAVLGVLMIAFAATLAVADLNAGWANEQPTGPARIAGFQAALSLNPISPSYRWLYAESIVDEATAAERAGQGADASLLNQGISAYREAAAADRGDPMVRVALSNVLINSARQTGQAAPAAESLQVAIDAQALAPRNPAVLAALAEAYRINGREADAQRAAQLAHQVAPAYAMQTLGTFGTETTTTP
jgi:O-antigen ligase